jgi:nucleotide-binding universal stress UspA family protein
VVLPAHRSENHAARTAEPTGAVLKNRSFHLLVPVDGCELSEHALGWALGFTRRTAARLTICSVCDPTPCFLAGAEGAMIAPSTMLESLEESAARCCAAAVAQAAAQDVLATCTVVAGEPAGAIVDVARSCSADMIVLGTHARRGIALGILGSVTAEIVRSSRVAVVAVRAETASTPEGPVVVALDESEASAAAATFALAIARVLNAPVHLIHVAAASDARPFEFDRVARQAEGMDIACTAEIRYGAIVEALITAAAERGAYLLATGSHGRGAAGRFFFGSVAEGLLRASVVPLLIVR